MHLKKILSKKNESKIPLINLITAIFIALFFPSRYWYKTIYIVSFFFKIKDYILFKNKKSLELSRVYHINALLALLTRTEIAFRIPYKLTIRGNLTHSSGLILCTVHLPLIKVAIKSIIDMGNIIDKAIVGTSTTENSMAVWGLKEKIPTIVKSSKVLLKAKTVLSNNGTVVLMIDYPRTGEYSPNIMHLCYKTNSKLVFFWAELTLGGIIETHFEEAPNPYCDSKLKIEENMIFLKQKSIEILERYHSKPIFHMF